MNTTAPSKNIRSHFLATLCVLILTCALLACDSHGVAVTIVSVDTGSRSLQNALSVALTGGSPVVNGDGAAVQIGYYQGATVANKFGNGDDCNFVTLIGAGNVLGLNLTVGDTAANGAGNGQIFADSNVSGRGSGGLTDPLFPPAGTPLVVRFFSATTVSGSQHFEAISNNSWLWINPVNGPPSMVFINFDDPGLVSKSGANVSAPGSSIRTIISYTCPSDPFIATHPVSQTVCVGQTATFSVTAAGTAPFTYQWKKNGPNIAGATSASYTTPATLASDNGALFTVTVTNSAGSQTSNNATLTVNLPPSITTQPVNQTVSAGQTATFSVTATGTAPLMYRWRLNGSDIPGAPNSPTLTVSNAQAGNAGTYDVIVSNACGSVPSAAANLVVALCVPCETWTARNFSGIWTSIASSADGNKLVAVLNGGQIYTSTDAGVIWTARESARAWQGVASSADGAKLVAVAKSAQIYTSTNSGVTWTAQTSPVLQWLSVASSSDGVTLVAGADNPSQLYISTNSGSTWTARYLTKAWGFVASSADGSKLVAVAGFSQGIHTSTDSGLTWVPRETTKPWGSVASSADGSKLAATTSGGQIYTSADFGVTWTPQNSGSRNWRSIASSATGSRLVAVVGNGQIYCSTDSGVTWTPHETNRNWYSVASSADGNKLAAVVIAGQIYTAACETTPIILNCATDKTVQCGTAWTFDPPTASGGCSSLTLAFSDVVTPGTQCAVDHIVSVNRRTWTATDTCSGQASCVQTVTVMDTTPPVFTFCPPGAALGCNPAGVPAAGTPTVTDACSTPVITSALGAITSSDCNRSQTRTYTATDACGNVATCTQTFTWTVDTTLPFIICPPNITVACGGDTSPAATGTATACDSCSNAGGVLIQLYTGHTQLGGGAPYSGLVGTITAPGVSFPSPWHPSGLTDFGADMTGCFILTSAGFHSFSLTSDDGSLLFIDGIQVVNNGGVHSPATASGSIFLTAGIHNFEVQFFQCCGDPSTVNLTLPPGVTYGALIPPTFTDVVTPQGIARTWRATDACGNSATCLQTITMLPPANDNCANAIAVVNGSPAACGSTRCATPSPAGSIPPPCGVSADSPDVWYSFTPPCDGPVTIDTFGLCPGQTVVFDTVLSVYTGPCGTLNPVDCNDDYPPGASDTQSSVTFNGLAGVTYRIRVSGWQGANGPFQLNVSGGTSPPPNDNCANAITVVNGSPAACGSTVCATPSSAGSIPPPCGASAGARDVWYTFTPPCNGPVTINTFDLCPGQPGFPFDTVLSVYTGPCGSLSQVACNDDLGDGSTSHYQSTVTFSGSAGVPYRIRVAGWNGTSGLFRLNVSGGTIPPPNDNCANAISVVAGSPAACGTTLCATPSSVGSIPPPCGESAGAPDVWYTFTPLCNGPVTINTFDLCPGQTAVFDTVLSAYTGPCGSLSQVACNDDALPWPFSLVYRHSEITFNGIAGVAYRIRVGGWRGARGSFRLNISVPVLPPVNDLCAAAIPVTIGSPAACGTTSCATRSVAGSIPIPCGNSAGSPDVWYTFTPQCSGPVIMHTFGLCPGQTGPAFDTVLSVYTGSCGSFSPVKCNDDAVIFPPFGTIKQSRVTFTGTAGVTYTIRVAGKNLASGPFALSISQTLTPPANDLCANATVIGNGTYAFNTCGANTDGPSQAGCQPNSDVWFRFTAPCSGQVSIDTCNSSFDTILSVYTGGCGSLGLVTCNDNATAGPCAPGPNSFVTFNVISGTTYRIRVGGAGAATGWGKLTLQGPFPAFPTCPPVSGSAFGRLFRVMGPPNNTPWSWSIGIPCCVNIGNANVAGVAPGDANTLAIAFASSINAACPGGGVTATALNNPNTPGLMAVYVSSCTTVPTPFVFRVGPVNTPQQSQCVVADVAGTDPLPTVGPCSFNPGIIELPLSGHDLNGNGLDDAIDIMTGTSADLNENGIPDEAEACLPPQLDVEPESQIVELGSNVTLSVTVTGTAPFTYQWSHAGAPLTNGGNISGATSNALTIQSVANGDLGDYSVMVSNACGTITSAPSTLSKATAAGPAITRIEFLKGGFQFAFEVKQGQTYFVEYKNSLTDPSWTTLETMVGDGLEHIVVDPGPLPPSRFYRVRTIAP